MPSKRMFIAINLPDEIKVTLRKVQDKLKNANPRSHIAWGDPDIIHLTLHFLGNVPEEKINAVKTAIETGSRGVGKLQIHLQELGFFPNERQARVIWIGLNERSGHLQKLHAQLRDALINVGFNADMRPWQPHLTLGRMRAPQVMRGLDAKVQSLQFTVHSAELMESILHPDGPEHIVFQKFELRG